MKRSNNFILKEMAGKTILVPFGDAIVDFNGIITLNDTAKFLWEHSENEISPADLVASLMEEYSIDRSTAEEAVSVFIKQMSESGCIIDE